MTLVVCKQGIPRQRSGKTDTFIETQDVLTDERIWAIYDNYDNRAEGGITKESLMDAFKRIGIDKTESDINRIFIEHDLDEDGKIDFKEFKGIFVSYDEISPFEPFAIEER